MSDTLVRNFTLQVGGVQQDITVSAEAVPVIKQTMSMESVVPREQRTPARWFNPAAFAPPPVLDPATGLPRLGNSGRNVIVGPGLNIMDAGIYKRFRMGGEKRMLTFRVELFNALNHPNWANPDINVSNVNTAATISDISKPMRQAKFAVRFDFQLKEHNQ